MHIGTASSHEVTNDHTLVHYQGLVSTDCQHGSPVQMLLDVYAGCVGTLIQDAKPGVVEEEPGHANALLLTCMRNPTASCTLSFAFDAENLVLCLARAMRQPGHGRCKHCSFRTMIPKCPERVAHPETASRPTRPGRPSHPRVPPGTAAAPRPSGRPGARPALEATRRHHCHPPAQQLPQQSAGI
jgi:hypothetical protein